MHVKWNLAKLSETVHKIIVLTIVADLFLQISFRGAPLEGLSAKARRFGG